MPDLETAATRAIPSSLPVTGVALIYGASAVPQAVGVFAHALRVREEGQPGEDLTEYAPHQLSDHAARLFADGGGFRQRIQQWRPYICPFHELIGLVPQGASVLDIGCGSGLFLGLLALDGRISGGVGVDTSVDAIETAAAMMKRLPPGHDLRFEQLEAGADLPRGAFGVVSMIDVLHHIPPAAQARAIRAAADRVAPGGTLIFKDIGRRPAWKALANRLHDLVLSREWIHYAPISAVGEWASTSGLTCSAPRIIDMLWYRHELIVMTRPADRGTKI